MRLTLYLSFVASAQEIKVGIKRVEFYGNKAQEYKEEGIIALETYKYKIANGPRNIVELQSIIYGFGDGCSDQIAKAIAANIPKVEQMTAFVRVSNCSLETAVVYARKNGAGSVIIAVDDISYDLELPLLTILVDNDFGNSLKDALQQAFTANQAIMLSYSSPQDYGSLMPLYVVMGVLFGINALVLDICWGFKRKQNRFVVLKRLQDLEKQKTNLSSHLHQKMTFPLTRQETYRPCSENYAIIEEEEKSLSAPRRAHSEIQEIDKQTGADIKVAAISDFIGPGHSELNSNPTQNASLGNLRSQSNRKVFPE